MRVLQRLAVIALGLTSLAGGSALHAQEWERLADGSMGRETEFHGVGGVAIPAYVRKPDGPGPFPVVVMLHGGRYGKAATVGMGRSSKSPTADFLKAGWVVYSADYRPSEKMLDPIEIDDTVEAVKAVRQLPFVDPARVGMMGGSHGANVTSRLVSRVDLRGAVLCAPAAIDLIEVKKASGRGEPVVSVLKKLIADMETRHGAASEEIEKDPARHGYATAFTEVQQVRCPILSINGRNDDNSPTSVIDVYARKLRAAGKEVDTYLPDNGPHGFYFGRPEIPEWEESTRRAVAFFRDQFARPAPPAAIQAPTQTPPSITGYGSIDWVDPDRSEPAGTKYKSFSSKTISRDVSYLVYLPPAYDQESSTRYPVLYYLHASGGTPARDATIAPRFDRAIRAGTIPPLIVVFVNGLRGATMYSDTRDGAYPLETVIVKDLVPHVDATYRTVATRGGRALEGFSMGGFGAAHLGFKYPEVFGVVSIQAPPLLGPELTQPLPARAWSRLFPTAMGGDLAYFRENDPFSLAVRNADALRDRSFIRIITHIEDENWLAPQCEKLHKVLVEQTIPHQFLYLSNVKSHNKGQVLETLGDAGLLFFGSCFERLQKQEAAARR